MTTQYPYKVTKAPVSPPKRVRLLIPCKFTGGPLNGQILKLEASQYGLPPATYKPSLAVTAATYRNIPGTANYIWK